MSFIGVSRDLLASTVNGIDITTASYYAAWIGGAIVLFFSLVVLLVRIGRVNGADHWVRAFWTLAYVAYAFYLIAVGFVYKFADESTIVRKTLWKIALSAIPIAGTGVVAACGSHLFPGENYAECFVHPEYVFLGFGIATGITGVLVVVFAKATISVAHIFLGVPLVLFFIILILRLIRDKIKIVKAGALVGMLGVLVVIAGMIVQAAGYKCQRFNADCPYPEKFNNNFLGMIIIVIGFCVLWWPIYVFEVNPVEFERELSEFAL